MIVLNAEFVKKSVQLATSILTRLAVRTLNITASNVWPASSFARKKQSIIKTKPKAEEDILTQPSNTQIWRRSIVMPTQRLGVLYQRRFHQEERIQVFQYYQPFLPKQYGKFTGCEGSVLCRHGSNILRKLFSVLQAITIRVRRCDHNRHMHPTCRAAKAPPQIANFATAGAYRGLT